MSLFSIFKKNEASIFDRIFKIVAKMARILVGLTENQKILSERYIELHATQELLVIRHEETKSQLLQQQMVNTELYSAIIEFARIMKAKGVDAEFPNVEFEVSKKSPKGPGVN